MQSLSELVKSATEMEKESSWKKKKGRMIVPIKLYLKKQMAGYIWTMM